MHPLVYLGKQVAMFPINFSSQIAVQFFLTFTLFNLFLLQHGLFVQIKKTTEKKWEINKSAFTEYTKEETYSGI